MVTNITSLTGNGLRDWLLQRLTSVYLAIYVLFLLAFFICHTSLTFLVWHALFQAVWFKIASMIALLMFVIHAWVGIWTVSTDYIKCTVVRLGLQSLVACYLLGLLLWGLLIVWGQ